MDKHTDGQTDGHHNSMTGPSQWKSSSRVLKKKKKKGKDKVKPDRGYLSTWLSGQKRSPDGFQNGCTALYCSVLHCTALYCTALHWTVLDWTALHCTVYSTAMYINSVQPCTAMPCNTVEPWTVLHCTLILYSPELYCTVLWYCTAPNYTTLVHTLLYCAAL